MFYPGDTLFNYVDFPITGKIRTLSSKMIF